MLAHTLPLGKLEKHASSTGGGGGPVFGAQLGEQNVGCSLAPVCVPAQCPCVTHGLHTVHASCVCTNQEYAPKSSGTAFSVAYQWKKVCL